jgi:hypothetical protein
LLADGYFTADALAADGARAEVEQALERLVDASLLQTSAPGRFRMQPLMRIFAAECAAAGRDGGLLSRSAATTRTA